MALRPGARDKKLHFLITGEELAELKRHAELMTEAFGLDRRIEKYQGKRPIGFYSWDLDCILCLEDTLNDVDEYPDKTASGYKALEKLLGRLRAEYDSNFR
jgi:hypothetical protein